MSTLDRRTLRHAWPLALFVAACGDGSTSDAGNDDTEGDTDSAAAALIGLWETTFQGESQACGEPEALTLPVPFRRITEVAPGELELWDCRTATDCDDFTLEDVRYTEAATGFRGVLKWGFFNETDGTRTCSQNARRHTMDLRPNGQVRVETESVEASVTDASAASEAACNAGVEAWSPVWTGTLLNCTRWDGRKVE